MRCPRCNTENRQGRVFCGGCGATLSAQCPECRFANEPGERFCGGCGKPLDDAVPPQRPAQVPERPSAELRPVTVLFADLVGFTTLSTRVDPERLKGWLDGYFETADELVLRFGGLVDKHIGDGVMAVFGAPVAHHDDPERALRCAAALHAAMTGLPGIDGTGAALHIGIASGTVMASATGSSVHQSYTVTGQSVNLAARLCERAEPGETLVSEAVVRLLGERFVGEALGAVSVQGFADPVAIWRMHGLGHGQGASGSTALIGRQRELRQLASFLDACRETRSGQVVILRGEAGIGKTRLVEAVEQMAEERDFACARALVLDFGAGKERDVSLTVAAALLDLPAAADGERRRTRVEQALAEGIITADRAPVLLDLLDLPLADEAKRVYDAMPPTARAQAIERLLGELLVNAARRRPVLLTIEDMHWADAPTLARVAALAGNAASPWLLLLSTRVEGDPLDAAWRARLRGTPVATIDLGPLSHEDGLALASSIALSTRDLGALVERSEGNPLFLVQLLRHADESVASVIPASIQSLVLARADLLKPEDKRLLQSASILGQRFDMSALCHLVDQPDATCAGLSAHHLILTEGDENVFTHALVHEAIYQSLPQARRQALHARAASWYERHDPMLHAQHLERAEDPRAACAYLAAARLARMAYRLDSALAMVERAMPIAQGEDRAAAALERGGLLHDLGQTQAAIDAFRDALGMIAEPADRARALIGLAAAMRIADRIDDALQCLDEAQAIAVPLGLAAETARIHYLRGSLYFPLGRIRDSRIEQERALAAARSAGSPEAEALALSGIADAYYAEGRMRSAATAFAQCIDLARRHGFGRIEVANLPMLGLTRYFIGEVQDALHLAEEAMAAAVRVGNKRAEIIATHIVGLVLTERDEFERARGMLERSRALAEELGTRRFEGESWALLAEIDRLEGDRASARTHALTALKSGRESGIDYIGGLILGEVAALTDDEEERRRIEAEALALLERGGIAHNHLWFYQLSLEAALARRDWGAVERWAGCLEAFTAAEPLAWSAVMIDLARLVLARANGAALNGSAGDLSALCRRATDLGYRRLARFADRFASGSAMAAAL